MDGEDSSRPTRLRVAADYVLARLDEPGTLRSLIWSLMGVMGMDQGETALTYVCGVASIVLGLISALRQERI